MKIIRTGANYNRGTTVLLDERAISTIRLDTNHNIEVVFKDVPHNRKTSHDYSITLTPHDIGKIMGEVYKQALTKNE